MTKASTLYNFWHGFGLNAYEENSVPTDDDKPSFPYITYTQASDSIGNSVALSASLWYRDTTWVSCNAKAEQISEAIGLGGSIVPYDGGAMWITRGSPFANSMGDDNDNMIKRKVININVEYISTI